jgi:excisionase family DNA binding protein
MMATDLLTLTAAAKAMGVSRSRLNQFVLEGRLKATRPGNEWLIAPADLAAFRKKERRPGPPLGSHRQPAT